MKPRGWQRRLRSVTGGKLFEIRPETAYTAADLNWSDRNSRSTVEMKDETSRPAIASRVADMAQYDTVFIGFPIWWYQAPRIIETFLESYDFRRQNGRSLRYVRRQRHGQDGKHSEGLLRAGYEVAVRQAHEQPRKRRVRAKLGKPPGPVRSAPRQNGQKEILTSSEAVQGITAFAGFDNGLNRPRSG